MQHKNEIVDQKKEYDHNKIFTSDVQVIDLLTEFIDFVKYDTKFKTVPTKSNFAAWLNLTHFRVTQRTVYNAINVYFPNIKKDYMSLIADCLAEGALLGNYKETMTIFCLKNWCEWADKVETKTETEHRYTLNVSLSDIAKEMQLYDEARNSIPKPNNESINA